MGWEKKSIGLISLQEHDSQPYAKQIHEKTIKTSIMLHKEHTTVKISY